VALVTRSTIPISLLGWQNSKRLLAGPTLEGRRRRRQRHALVAHIVDPVAVAKVKKSSLPRIFDWRPRRHDDLLCAARHQRKPSLSRAHAGQHPQQQNFNFLRRTLVHDRINPPRKNHSRSMVLGV
jgi:hypothetical protein